MYLQIYKSTNQRILFLQFANSMSFHCILVLHLCSFTFLSFFFIFLRYPNIVWITENITPFTINRCIVWFLFRLAILCKFSFCQFFFVVALVYTLFARTVYTSTSIWFTKETPNKGSIWRKYQKRNSNKDISRWICWTEMSCMNESKFVWTDNRQFKIKSNLKENYVKLVFGVSFCVLLCCMMEYIDRSPRITRCYAWQSRISLIFGFPRF